METWERERIFYTLLLKATKTDTDNYTGKVELKKHPFGLPRLEKKFDPNARSLDQIFFVGQPQITNIDNALEEIIKLLTYFITLDYDDTNLRLRIIATDASKDNQNQHRIFYELATAMETIIIGGCTDYSGGGKTGKEQMDRVFGLLKDIYQTEIESTTITYVEATSAISALEKEIHEYNNG
ncbi:MAG: hypothetical protein COV55_00280 [Candidatus Komeilibacteria bacterium CG11_big_fil_rev_8_21_14_0_20_36_20]|uniref:Uncharacterized protein n=1 Tax=Candidatus Komeilibacteria bacterium CG11_big_fil_rev_8_21_14_0_20_36_20 TaxID=1974477 RepID=A0A2H0NGP0_9BACT|nr:MAG: hypothetical protein COV55_00280 [Candidatus Komeilibacteria bacterium CG11_big_fil_rev_8_21_14_0_20_36_20]PIR81548.1 MAG: hypothetical protein COU21_03165 [Candidatus Komeilibacteria bacterium CG10_big_fil_rev_8_21_14_0_10_36_65]PJC55456.1 MAG: hypothetical protein CO027_02005 [Candidatus Komeilibacteria bacterium CG_4_9_14_0_2_um_filter_36_13]